MILKLVDGPMDGAHYVLSKRTEFPEERSTNRKPDGLWFDGKDEHGRNVQEQYANCPGETESFVPSETGGHVVLIYRYTGKVVGTGIEMGTKPIHDWCADPSCPICKEELRRQDEQGRKENQKIAAEHGIDLDKLAPVPEKALEDYEREMTEDGIPKIIEAVERRQRLAIEARNRVMGKRQRDEPHCGRCGGLMTPQNARHRPELFLHDACLLDELKREAADKQSYDDLAASGGIVDAP